MTPRQEHVLSILDGGPRTRNDWAAWYPLRTEQVYGIIRSLYRRGLVDVDGFEGRSRTFRITEKGRTALGAIVR